MANVKMGFTGIIYYGAAGSTGSTQLQKTTDISYTLDIETGETTVRGDSSGPPIKTESVTARATSIEWTMINDITDTALEALRVAAAAGTAVAIRTKDYSSGKGFDGDCIMKWDHGKPLKGEQTLKFTATPSLDGGRSPSLYV